MSNRPAPLPQGGAGRDTVFPVTAETPLFFTYLTYPRKGASQ